MSQAWLSIHNPMKIAFRYWLTISFLFCLLGAQGLASTINGKLQSIDLKENVIVVSSLQGLSALRFRPGVAVTLNGKRASEVQLTPGMSIVIVSNEPGQATSISATEQGSAPNSVVKPGDTSPLTSSARPPSPFGSFTTLTEDSGAIKPLEQSERRKWKTKNGDWKFSADSLTGSGDSSITYERNIRAPFKLSFDIEVIDGMRPRVFLGKYSLANEGYSHTLGLYPSGNGSTLFDYENKHRYAIEIHVSNSNVTLKIDGKVIDSRSEGLSRIEKLEFCGGDGWSRGTTRYSNIVITPGSAQ